MSLWVWESIVDFGWVIFNFNFFGFLCFIVRRERILYLLLLLGSGKKLYGLVMVIFLLLRLKYYSINLFVEEIVYLVFYLSGLGFILLEKV